MERTGGLYRVRAGAVSPVETKKPGQESRQDRRWKQDNPDKTTDHHRRYRQANPDKAAEAVRQWGQANPEKKHAIDHRRRTRKTNAGGSFTAEEFNALCAYYGNKCLCCNRTGIKLTVDHIKPVSRGGNSNIENIQPLCGKCNSSKGDKNIDYRPDAGPIRWLQAKLFG